MASSLVLEIVVVVGEGVGVDDCVGDALGLGPPRLDEAGSSSAKQASEKLVCSPVKD